MARMFENCTAFNQDLAWVTSKVANFEAMFYLATAFNGDVSKFDTRSATNLESTFSGATAFNRDISSWTTSKVTRMAGLFDWAISFNIDISGWQTAKVTDFQQCFSNAVVFNQPIGSWNTGNVLNLGLMFGNARAFNQTLSWDVSRVEDFYGMFMAANSFEGDAISSWNVTAGCVFGNMFYKAARFNQNLNDWRPKVTSGSTCDTARIYSRMFRDSACPVQADPIPGPFCQHPPPTSSPSRTPSRRPSARPSRTPSRRPSAKPSRFPSAVTLPSISPSKTPSSPPTVVVRVFKANIKACLRRILVKARCGCGSQGKLCFEKAVKTQCLRIYKKKNLLNSKKEVESFQTKMRIAFDRRCAARLASLGRNDDV